MSKGRFSKGFLAKGWPLAVLGFAIRGRSPPVLGTGWTTGIRAKLLAPRRIVALGIRAPAHRAFTAPTCSARLLLSRRLPQSALAMGRCADGRLCGRGQTADDVRASASPDVPANGRALETGAGRSLGRRCCRLRLCKLGQRSGHVEHGLRSHRNDRDLARGRQPVYHFTHFRARRERREKGLDFIGLSRRGQIRDRAKPARRVPSSGRSCSPRSTHRRSASVSVPIESAR